MMCGLMASDVGLHDTSKAPTLSYPARPQAGTVCTMSNSVPESGLHVQLVSSVTTLAGSDCCRLVPTRWRLACPMSARRDRWRGRVRGGSQAGHQRQAEWTGRDTTSSNETSLELFTWAAHRTTL